MYAYVFSAHLGSDVTLGNGCVIGVGLSLQSNSVPDKMHLYLQDDMIQQRAGRDLPQVCICHSQRMQETLKNLWTGFELLFIGFNFH